MTGPSRGRVLSAGGVGLRAATGGRSSPSRCSSPVAFVAAALGTPVAYLLMPYGGWFLVPPTVALWWTAFGRTP